MFYRMAITVYFFKLKIIKPGGLQYPLEVSSRNPIRLNVYILRAVITSHQTGRIFSTYLNLFSTYLPSVWTWTTPRQLFI